MTEPTKWENPRIAKAFWVCPHCKCNVAERIVGAIDTSCGLPEDVAVICSECGAELQFHLRWSRPDIHSVQLMDAGEPWFETQDVEIEWECGDCGETFWEPAENGLRQDVCPECGSRNVSEHDPDEDDAPAY